MSNYCYNINSTAKNPENSKNIYPSHPDLPITFTLPSTNYILYNNLYPLYFLLHPSSYQSSTKTKPPSIFHLPIHYSKLDKITLKLPNYAITSIRINPTISFFTIHAIEKRAILSFKDLSVLKFHGWHRDVLITRQSEYEPPPEWKRFQSGNCHSVQERRLNRR